MTVKSGAMLLLGLLVLVAIRYMAEIGMSKL